MATGTPRGRDLDGREQQRDRGRRSDVLAPQPRGREAEVVLAGAGRGALRRDERDRVAGRQRRGHDADRIDDALVDVAREPRPVDPAIEARPERGGIEQAREPHARDTECVTHEPDEHSRTAAPGDPCDYVLFAHLQPERDRVVDLLRDGPVGERGQQSGVDRANAGPAPDPDALAARLERGKQNGHRADLIRTPPTAARQNGGDRAARRSKAAVPGRCRHRPGRRR